MTTTQCFPNDIRSLFYLCSLLNLLISFFLGLCSMVMIFEVKKRCKKNRIDSGAGLCCVAGRTKKLCIAAENSSTLNKVKELMTSLLENENVAIEQLRLKTKDTKPGVKHFSYILCCAEQTTTKGITLSDQLGAITRHAKKANAQCAILVLGTRDPPYGQLYDESQMGERTRSQSILKEYSDTKRLFSFCNAFNVEQEKAIRSWLNPKPPNVHEDNGMQLRTVHNSEIESSSEHLFVGD